MKVVCTSPSFAKYSDNPVLFLKKKGISLERLPADITEEQFIEAAGGADAAIVAFNQITPYVLDRLPSLKIVCKHGVGIDNIDLHAAKERNVWVTNAPNANKHAVADFVFGLMLSAARQIPAADRETKLGKWPRIFGSDVYGKTLGIVGLGMIGKEVAKRAQGFNMTVLAYDVFPDRAFAADHHIQFTELDHLLKESDFITLHMPLTAETENMIGEKELAAMKETAYLINASRGGIVSECALYDALANGSIAGAALDVYQTEPLKQHPLFELDRFIAMPHIAGYTRDAVQNLGMICVKNIASVLIDKQKPEFVVNGL
ncbi:Hydroxypyruvate reductase [Bacillus paralicheniformis]|uniref:Phosphoglycerate dehydrogenase n=1 Tax=Bacillus paralicheniformis TaxID=1648923 RepID=A0AAW6KBT0_9BACI|nr:MULTISPECIES: phosphoglycerate dehydrogenase [Bacillus]ARA87308.1 hydroxyacid dehydrogenase [Bacillus paralicheniformis]MBG9882296.1 hydroxyacid dehydrogenase [Bacillus paralicheniformis]MBW4887519.1 phosphoglycerate dehydrogenase [Bacillus sp. (in: firmicutes)]MCY8039212.1 phosphoglycerate dehydrogenase [Bacillus paralicheniformis]MCY8149260.1 phosphoglycerate dehydrogenase [Bacillus paralicheniformis]